MDEINPTLPSSSPIVHLASKVISTTAQLVSFDLFDTLLFRREDGSNSDSVISLHDIGPSNEVHTRLDIIPTSTNHSMRNAAEILARRQSRNEEINIHEIYEKYPITKISQAQLINIELETLKKLLVFNPVIIDIVQKLIFSGREVCFTSDTFLPKDFLLTILQAKIPSIKASSLLISSDEGVIKGTGRLFDVMIERYGLKPNNILHVGDHSVADFERPVAAGIASIWIGPSLYALKVEKARNQLINRHFDFYPYFFAIGRTSVSSIHFCGESPHRFWFEFSSLVLGPLLHAFSRWILLQASQLGITKLFCITREGHVLQRVIESTRIQLVAMGFEELRRISVELFFSSRQASFLPLVSQETPVTIVDMVISRVDMNLSNVLECLGIDANGELPDSSLSIRSSDFDSATINGQVVRAWLYQTVASHWDGLSARSREQRDLLNDYLDVKVGTNKFAFIELGCNGTIYSQLARTLVSPPEHYFHLFSTVQAYERMLSKGFLHSFVDSFSNAREAVNVVARSPEVLEAILNGTTPTTLRYSRDIHNVVIPLLDDFESLVDSTPLQRPEPQVPISAQTLCNETDIFSTIETGIFSWIRASEAIRAQIGLPKTALQVSAEERSFCFEQLARVVAFPTSEEALNIGPLCFGRNFGSTKSRALVTDENIDFVRSNGLFSILQRINQNFNYEKSNLVWPSGAIEASFPGALAQSHFEGIRSGLSSSLIESLLSKLLPLKGQTVVVYGNGRVYQELKPHLRDMGIKVKALLDRNAKANTQSISEPIILDISDYQFSDSENVIIASTGFVAEMRQNLVRYGKDLNLNIISF